MLSPDNSKPWKKGYKILNRYEILEIKKGGMGIVYLVYDHEWNRRFAIKTFQEQYLWDEKAIQRFIEEAETWTILERHTNIVFANFVQKIEGKPMIFLEYIDGGDLSRFIGKLGIPESLDFAIQFCTGMEYAYQKLGVIHRDIKPGNVMVQKDTRFRSGYCFKITDFGLVKALGAEFDEKAFQVSTGLGTIQYMPPEQFPEEAKKLYSFHWNVTTKSDIYSFGITLFQLITGRLPFNGINQIFTQEPVHPKSFNPAIPDKLDTLIMKCIEKNPDRRYSNFSELKEELIGIFLELTKEVYFIIGKKEKFSKYDWGNKGFALGNLGKFQKAIDCFDKAIELDPRSANPWQNKGNILFLHGNYSEAIVCLNKAIELDPKYYLAWSNKGEVLFKLGKYSEAIDCCNKAIELEPGFAPAWGIKGTSLSKLGKYSEAIDCCNKAIELEPGFAPAWNNKGNIYSKLGEIKEAIDCYDKAIQVNPRFAESWNNKGNIFSRLGKYSEAIDCYDKAIQIDPEIAKVWNNKGSTLSRLEKYSEAIDCYDKAIQIDPEIAKVWNNKGSTLSRLEKYSEAIDCYDKAIQIDPEIAKVWNNKGSTLSILEKYREAIGCYEKVLEINPKNTIAWFNKGITLANLGNRQEAIKCIENFIALAPPQNSFQIEQAKQILRQLRGF